MSPSPYVRSVAVLLLTLFVSAAFAIALSTPLTLGGSGLAKSAWAWSLIFVLICAFAAACVSFFAGLLLYDKADVADLQVLGGVRLGGSVAAFLNGKGASWPFAKMSASRDGLRLQTPFGDFFSERNDPHLSLERAGFTAWTIALSVHPAEPVVFFAVPWQSKMIGLKLKELGYSVAS